jgi:hypothetical protein
MWRNSIIAYSEINLRFSRETEDQSLARKCSVNGLRVHGLVGLSSKTLPHNISTHTESKNSFPRKLFLNNPDIIFRFFYSINHVKSEEKSFML